LYDYELAQFYENVMTDGLVIRIKFYFWEFSDKNGNFWSLSVCPWPTKKMFFFSGNFYTSYLDHSPNLIIAYKTRIFPIKFFFLFLCAHCVHSHFYTFFFIVVCRWHIVFLCCCCIMCFASLFRWRLQKKRCFFCCYAL